MMRERWKWVVGYEGHYQVSDQGRVRSVDREIEIPTRWGGSFKRMHKGQLLKLQGDRQGYLRACLYQQSKLCFTPVHRLVALVFIPNPKNLPEVDHKNGIRSDARRKNLQRVTRGMNDRLAKQRRNARSGAPLTAGYLTSRQVQQARKLKARGVPYTRLAEKFGVSDVAIRHAVRGNTWRHV